MKYILPPQISIGAVELTIRNLDHSLSFYTQVIGLQLRARKDGIVELGTEKRTLLRLSENPQAQKTLGTTGLYHFAILVPERKDLAAALERIIRTETPVQGFADHGVSEAIYLPDLDGNGIEIYRDRPRQQWPFKDGELQMVTDPLDLDSLRAELDGDQLPYKDLSTRTNIGHLHLHVRDIPEAVNFYRDVLGFDLKQRYGPSAAFLAAGDYHHHIGVNTWAGAGAPPAPKGSVGLRNFRIILPDQNTFENLGKHIHQSGVETTTLKDGFSVRDPSGNQVIFESASPIPQIQ